MNFPVFTRYEASVRSYAGDPRAPSFLMSQEGDVSVYYAPFEWVNPQARVVLVGITPGKVQAGNALYEAKRAIEAGLPLPEVLKRAKAIGAFSGAMRPNLIRLLDYISLNKWLAVASCAELFDRSSHLLQTASVLQFPVFINGENYNGTPDPVKHPLLRSMLTEHFGSMARALPDAVFIPLGPVPSKAMKWLASQGVMSASRILEGLPHPSGANAERIAYFLGRKGRADLSRKTDPQKLDAARQHLLQAVGALT